MALARQEPIHPTIASLQAELNQCSGEWFTAVKAYVETELGLIKDESSLDKIKNIQGVDVKPEQSESQPLFTGFESAFIKIMTGELDNFSDDKKMVRNLSTILELLVLDKNSKIYTSFVERDKKACKPLPSIALIKLAVVRWIESFLIEEKLDFAFLPQALDKIVLHENVVFIEGKNYEFTDISHLVNKILEPYKIDVHQTDIFEHSLLRLAKTAFPTSANFGDTYYSGQQVFRQVHTIIQGHGLMHLGVSSGDIQKTIHFLNHYCGEDTAERIFSQIPDVNSLKFNINKLIKKIMSKEYQDHLHSFLSQPDILACYQLKQNNEEVSFQHISNELNKILSHHKMTSKSDAVEASLLLAFGVDKELLAPQFGPLEEFDSFSKEIYFRLNLVKEDIDALIFNINAEFPHVARWQKEYDLDGTHYHVISVQNEAVISPAFLKKIADGLAILAETKPDLLEMFQVASGTRQHTVLQLSKELNAMADIYKEKDPRLATHLSQFSLFVKQRTPKEEMAAQSFELSKAIANHEAQVETPHELKLFKEGKKQVIKNIQTELGLRL